MQQELAVETVRPEILEFIRREFLDGDPRGELTEETPLLEWGILNSFNTAVLIGWVREHFDREIPIEKVTSATFRTVTSLSDAICS